MAITYSWLSSYVYNGYEYKRGDAIQVEGYVWSSMNAADNAWTGDYDLKTVYFYGYAQWDDGKGVKDGYHPLTICSSPTASSSSILGYMEMDSIKSGGTPNKYTVSYNANGGTGAPSSQTKTHGVRLQLSSTIPTRTGYTFLGWGVSSSDTTVDYAAGSYYEENAAIKLYAIWKINSYKLTINPNGGTWEDSTESQVFEQDYGTTKEIENPARVGYTFDGWTVSGKGSLSGTKYTYGAGAGTITAKWTRIVLKVTFDASANGGSPNSSKSVSYGDTVGTLPTPKKPYYKFIGWFTKAVGGTQVDAAQVITSNVTYYAQFKLDATVKVGTNGEKKPAIVWIGQNGVWKKHIVWIGKNGTWNKSTGAD